MHQTMAVVQRAQSSQPVPSERRTEARFRAAADKKACLVERPQFWSWSVTLRNLSANGIGLVARFPPRPGSIIAVDVPARRPSQSLTLVAQVAHATPLPNGEWLVGAALRVPLFRWQIAALLG